MKLKEEAILAMAIAAIAEETGTEAKKLRVLSFGEVQKSSLQEYIEKQGIFFKKYQLGD